MNRLARWMIALWAILSVSGWGTAQVDTCYGFQDRTFPSGWIARYADGTDASSRVYVYTGYMYVSAGSNDIYIILPDNGVDFSDGVAMNFYYRNGSMDIGTLSSSTNTASFNLMREYPAPGTIYRREFIDLSSAPTNHHNICFRIKQGEYVYLKNIYISHTTGIVGNFGIRNAMVTTTYANWNVYHNECSNDTMFLKWDSFADHTFSLTVINSYYDTLYHNPDQSGNSIPLPTGAHTLWIRNFISSHNGCSIETNEGITITVSNIECDSTPCVNTNTLFSTKCTPYYGTYENPYLNIGNYTPNPSPTSQMSRHLICTDTTMTDPVIGSQLRIVPPGENHSVRLGNWNTGGEAEAMLYTIDVDTSDFDMLILKYAAVMEDPNHDATNQPRFRIEMLDSADNLIAPAGCNSYDFVSSPELGWNTASWNHGTVLWKDWTIVGINLSDYHNQTVRLRLTTYDCAMSAHFGYAYYNLACAKKTLSFSSCSEGDSNVIEAPQGFNYRWHRDDSEATISTDRIVTIPVDGHHYYCDLGFIGNASCSVTLSVLSTLVWPEAEFGFKVSRENCRFRIDFTNSSHHVGDTNSTCDGAYWDFGTYGNSTLLNPVLYIPDTGTFTVSLLASIPGGNCVDTAYGTLHLALANDTIDTAICENHSLSIYDSIFRTAGNYTLRPNCDSVVLLRLSLLDTALFDTTAIACDHLDYRSTTFYADTVSDFIYTNAAGCDSTHRLHLTVYPEFELPDTVVICPGHSYMESGRTPPYNFDTMLHSIHGCDSLVHVALVARDSSYRLHTLYQLDSATWHPADSIILGCAPDTLHLRDTTTGAVAWFWTVTAGSDTLTGFTNEIIVPYPNTNYQLQTTNSFRLIVVDNFGCIDSVSHPVYIFRTPQAEFDWEYPGGIGINPPIERPEVQMINLSSPMDSLTYLWRIPRQVGSDDCDTTSEVNPFYHWGQPGENMSGEYNVQLIAYWLQYAADTAIHHICTDTASHIIIITNDYLEFPNLVTPNGDGMNDIWRVVNLIEYGNYPTNELWIYNQWGAEVYHASDIRKEEDFWDPNATSSPEGTYYFRFTGRSPYGVVKRNGVIEVLR